MSLAYSCLGVVAPVTYQGMEVAPHLQQALQGLHHLLLAEALESGLVRELAALQLSNGGFQRHGGTLEDAHTCGGHRRSSPRPLPGVSNPDCAELVFFLLPWSPSKQTS